MKRYRRDFIAWALVLSNYTLSTRAESLSALAPSTVWETCITAIATPTTTVWKALDVCRKNYRYLQGVRKDQRCLIDQNYMHHLQTIPTARFRASLRETSTSYRTDSRTKHCRCHGASRHLFSKMCFLSFRGLRVPCEGWRGLRKVY